MNEIKFVKLQCSFHTHKARLRRRKLFAMKKRTNLELNDAIFRIVLIPFFGIAIPLVMQMIKLSEFTTLTLLFAYGYTIFLAFIIWQGNRYLLFSLRNYFDWFNKP